jgi:hypothetical protein
MYVQHQNVEVIRSMDTDRLPAKEDALALAQVRNVALRLNNLDNGD